MNCCDKAREYGKKRCASCWSWLIPVDWATHPNRIAAITKHGGSGTITHDRWRGMMGRAGYESGALHPYHGGRGIVVHERYHDFVNFLADIGECPSPDHELDRIDNDKNYEPGNIRWATQQEQARNRREKHCSICGQVGHNYLTCGRE